MRANPAVSIQACDFSHVFLDPINDSNYDSEVNTGVVLVDFWATWCGPCKMQAPVNETLSNQYPTIKFVSMDVDKNPLIPSREGIQSIPTMYLLKDGKLISRIVGYTPKPKLEAMLIDLI